MSPLDGRPVVTAAQMRAAEQLAIERGSSVAALMDHVGRAVAEVVRRIGGGGDVLVLCGSGNNGGDGYVAAAALKAAGIAVRVAASSPPRGEAAIAARAGWDGAVETLADAAPASVLVDALFGTGLNRALDDAVAAPLRRLVEGARLSVAVDVPSGVQADTGEVLGPVPAMAVTLALGAAKPAHLLQPAARLCGTVRVLDIGVTVDSDARVIARPTWTRPGPDSHKFNRGMVAVVRGRMAGAAHLAATAAMHAGAGYVVLLGASMPEAPYALVRKPLTDDALDDPRIGAVVIGPGLGRDEGMREPLDQALASDRPLVIDGDALRLLTPERIAARGGTTILTPHAGEFDALFGAGDGSKLDRARDAATRSGAVVVFKGPDTVIAAPDGRAILAGDANDWLSTAGTGDVLTGAIGAALSSGMPALDAAAAGVWLHGEAARRLGAAFIADELAVALKHARGML
ncbi:yjeF C-terminal region, hydroxyethylthiazole kinase-related/yjeF N-terminal region [Sphingomonas gellani]|uniref:Bifunctional NAD(P)H-hydrate repair enzyme n=1 Tax=Sphingomonas gellani TaxID=1166340 RepID=A0A1H7ZTP5_9SPHN|nr:NAD(P)H-hydrate dehydratase [Sphingomonas gellani]SEM61656.1 yjeF C-terminal region, hydroxyethylthiazole kinase-related/yjeF N-terminal region [Sphingomonas gellani]